MELDFFFLGIKGVYDYSSDKKNGKTGGRRPKVKFIVSVDVFPSTDILEPRQDQLNKTPLRMEATWKYPKDWILCLWELFYHQFITIFPIKRFL